MSLKQIDSRDQTAFTLTDKGDAWTEPSESHVPWATVGSSSNGNSIDISPGRYRIDTIGVQGIVAYSVSSFERMGNLTPPTDYLVAHQSGTRLFCRGAGTVFITRLA